MLYCPLCRAEFDDRTESCGSCECALVTELEPEVELPMPEPPLALLVRADVASAGIIAAELGDHGVACHIQPGQAFSLAGLTYSRILVSQKDGPKAAAILEELRRKHPKLGLDYTGQTELPLPGY
jgi:hypothetical protein